MANTKSKDTKKKKAVTTKEEQKKKTAKKVTKAKKGKKQEKDLATKILLVIFLVLCVVVFVLATVMITENGNNEKTKYDIQVPITEEELSDGVNIKIAMDDVEKNQSKEYRILAKNYIDDDNINTTAMNYQMKVTTSKGSNIAVEVYSSKENFELLQGKKKITDLHLRKDKKQQVTYTFKLTQKQEPSEDDYVEVEFTKEK